MTKADASFIKSYGAGAISFLVCFIIEQLKQRK